MSRSSGRQAFGALAVWFFVFAPIVAPLLLGQSHAAAQAKPGVGHGGTIVGDEQYIAIPVRGLPGKMVWTIAFDPDGRPWVGTNRGGATQQDDGTWQWLTKVDGLDGDAVKAYLFQPDGSMWVGTDRAIDVFATPVAR